MKRKDIVIDMLKYGNTNIENGITKEELQDYLENKCGYKLENVILTIALYWAENFKFHSTNPKKHILTSAGYFRYLQYVDLQNARRNSFIAKFFSSISILIAAYAIYISSFGISDVNVSSLNENLKDEFFNHTKNHESNLILYNIKIDTIKNNSDTIVLKVDLILKKDD